MPSAAIQRLRERLDEIDDRIVALLVERMGLSEQIGKEKARAGADVDFADPEREAAVVERLKRVAGDGLPAGLIEAVYREVMAESLRRQVERR